MNEGEFRNSTEEVQDEFLGISTVEDVGRLAHQLFDKRNLLSLLQDEVRELEYQFRYGMSKLEATEILDPRLEIKLEPASPNYNDPESKLDLKVLFEMIGEQSLIDMGAYRPEYLETEPQRIPEKWFGTGLNKVRKLGRVYADIIDKARRPRRAPRVVIKEHKTPTTWHEDTGL